MSSNSKHKRNRHQTKKWDHSRRNDPHSASLGFLGYCIRLRAVPSGDTIDTAQPRTRTELISRSLRYLEYIPKPDGRQRPLAVAALEDKIVQRATAAVLNAIYEEDFLGFSYGFRPGRGTHDALNALCVAIERKKVNWILDADIRSFFDEISQEC